MTRKIPKYLGVTTSTIISKNECSPFTNPGKKKNLQLRYFLPICGLFGYIDVMLRFVSSFLPHSFSLTLSVCLLTGFHQSPENGIFFQVLDIHMISALIGRPQSLSGKGNSSPLSSMVQQKYYHYYNRRVFSHKGKQNNN